MTCGDERGLTTALRRLAPGFTILCTGLPPDAVAAVARAVGPRGLVLAPVDRGSKTPLPSACALLRCELRALPVLSHALDAALAPAAALGLDGVLTELRRTLAPLGLLVACALRPEMGERLRGSLEELGFALEPAVAGSDVLIAAAPGRRTVLR